MLSDGRHASLSSSFSEIEFGRARPTSLLHSTIHLLIPSGEERRRENEVQELEEREREGMKEGRKVQRREDWGKREMAKERRKGEARWLGKCDCCTLEH